MRAPAFWFAGKPDWRARALWPLGALYGAVTARRMGGQGARVGVPVICVGNFVAGGAGKTPTALAIAALLREMGEAPAFLSRGYGGTAGKDAPLLVDPAHHDAALVGDEPLLLARAAPTIVAADRPAGALAARLAGASVIIMDDGLQNRSLHQDVRFAVVDGATGVGNGFCVPAGPLRAPLATQTPHVTAVVLIGEGEAGERVADAAARAGKPVLRARLTPDADQARALAGRDVVAFAGIGRPEKFFATLREIGARIVAAHAFGDHHPYAREEIAGLQAEAEARGAMLLTTEKDMARLSVIGCASSALHVRVWLEFYDSANVLSLLRATLARHD
jgi:tetraacyldisaccharide 4'-kinase